MLATSFPSILKFYAEFFVSKVKNRITYTVLLFCLSILFSLPLNDIIYPIHAEPVNLEAF